MKCPVCNFEKAYKCTNSLERDGLRKRTYKCRKCGATFHTKEVITDFKADVDSMGDFAGMNVLELMSMFEDLQKEVLQLKRKVDTLSMLHG